MDYEPITLAELKEMGRRIDIETVWAHSVPELYEKLNTSYPNAEWTLLRAPEWCGEGDNAILCVPVVKPRNDEEEE